MVIHRMTYFSKANFSSDRAKLRDEIKSILGAAKKNNPALGITGGLLYVDNYFIQTVEGPRENLSQLFSKLCRDERHKDLVICEMVPSITRAFADWAMTCVSVRDIEQLDLGDHADRSNCSIPQMPANWLREAVRKTCHNASAAARTEALSGDFVELD